MQKVSEFIFTYPPNLQELDLATMVSMYRDRGEPRRAAPGKYLACSVTHKLLKNAKWWFGLYYSQYAWDSLLTKHSEGFPLTEAELNLLGLIVASGDEPPHREFVEENIGVTGKLAYLIVNDVRDFGFIHEDEHGYLYITQNGEKALQGVCRRIYGKRFVPEMLDIFHRDPAFARKTSSGDDQPTLF
ncbi:MAG: hypothetical protein GVY02_08925 [Bacteroidetes bacterium]|jgi:hypothetical protein|nr:hypothetical protein [Bacteroidota bacterium]